MKAKIIIVNLLILILFLSNTDKQEGTYLNNKIYRFSLGGWECTVINDGVRTQPLSRVFDDANIKRLLPVIQKNKIDTTSVKISFNILILRNKQHTVVIDPGYGKDMGINSGKLMQNLRIANIDSSKVDCVILTHGHWDHIGGVTNKDGRLNFPNAKYYMSQKEWDFWTLESNLEKLPKNWADWAHKNLPPIKDKITLLTGKEEIVQGIVSLPENGHTPGMISLLISSGKEKMLYISDVMHCAFQMEVPDVCPKFDMDTIQSTQKRKALLEMVKKERYLIFAYHFDFPGVVDLK